LKPGVPRRHVDRDWTKAGFDRNFQNVGALTAMSLSSEAINARYFWSSDDQP
jgi:hypothetical protein